MSCLWAVKGASRVKKDVWQVTWFRLVHEKKKSQPLVKRVCCEIKAYLLFERGVNQITLGMSTMSLVCIQYFCQIWQPSHSWWPRCHWLPSGSFQMFSGHDIEWLGCEPFGEYVDITANVMKYASESDVSAQSADLTLKFENPRTTLVWHQLHNKVVLVSRKKNPATARNFA